MATQPSTAPTQSPRLGTAAKPLDPSAIPVQKQGEWRSRANLASLNRCFVSDFKNTGNTPDQLLLYFAVRQWQVSSNSTFPLLSRLGFVRGVQRTPLEQISPRPTTGTIHLWKDFDVVGFQVH